MMAQELIAAKSQELHQIVDEVVTLVSDGVQQGTPIHEVESKAFRTLLQAGRTALQLLVDCLGDGDLERSTRCPMVEHSNDRPNPRNGPMCRSLASWTSNDTYTPGARATDRIGCFG